MALKLEQGDYVPDGQGGFVTLGEAEAVLQRALLRLTARRGQFPPMPELGSRLHQLGRERASARGALAAQYVWEALEPETELTVTGTDWQETGAGRGTLRVDLEWRGTPLSLSVDWRE